MRYLSKFSAIIAMGFTLLTAQVSFADDISTQEANALIKEDIANAQVLTEMCPALIGKNAKFDQNIQTIITGFLNDYSDKSATLESLQKDTEFQSFLKDARQAAKEVSQAEQKSVCDDTLNFKA